MLVFFFFFLFLFIKDKDDNDDDDDDNGGIVVSSTRLGELAGASDLLGTARPKLSGLDTAVAIGGTGSLAVTLSALLLSPLLSLLPTLSVGDPDRWMTIVDTGVFRVFSFAGCSLANVGSTSIVTLVDTLERFTCTHRTNDRVLVRDEVREYIRT